jgi:hypothetical protein
MAARSSFPNWSGCDGSRIRSGFRARILERKPLRIRGGGSKDFYGGPLAGDCSTRAAMPASSATSRPNWWSPRAAARRWRAGVGAGGTAQFLACEPPHFGAPRSAAPSPPASPARAGQAVGSLRDFVLGVKLMDGEGRVLSLRRRGDEERRRLRRLAPDRRQPGHAGPDPRGLAQGAAAAGRREEPAPEPPRRSPPRSGISAARSWPMAWRQSSGSRCASRRTPSLPVTRPCGVCRCRRLRRRRRCPARR